MQRASYQRESRIRSFSQILSHTVEAALSTTIPVVYKSLCSLGMLPLRPLKLEGSSDQYPGTKTSRLSPDWQSSSILYSKKKVTVKGTGGIC